MRGQAAMRFVLHYRGPLRGNGRDKKHIHEVRRVFHPQMKKLWEQDVLTSGIKATTYARDAFEFVPLVSAERFAIAELSVMLLRPGPPGNLLTQGGDIDNRLKTLFDALAIPRHQESLPSGAAPTEDESPFYCLLEDDSLVTSFSVRAEQLLEPGVDESEVDLTGC
jgi:hypothetical protein